MAAAPGFAGRQWEYAYDAIGNRHTAKNGGNAVGTTKARKRTNLLALTSWLYFQADFGEIGRSFIHVHQLVEVSSIGKDYLIHPIKDLIPVCPNCHALLHRRSPAFTPAEIKARRVQQG